MIGKETEIRSILAEEESAMTDYSPLFRTFNIRIACLKLLVDNRCDKVAIFNSLNLIGARDDQIIVAALRSLKSQQDAVVQFTLLLQAQRKALPISDYDKTTSYDALLGRVGDIGEGIETTADLKGGCEAVPWPLRAD